MSEGLHVVEHTDPPYWSVRGRDCEITIQRRPGYCDRGNYIAEFFVDKGKELELYIDGADGWPRYYFDWDRMLGELQAWLERRKQLPTRLE